MLKRLYLREILLQETEVRPTLRQLSYLKYAIEYAYLVVHANNRFYSAIVTVEILSEFRSFARLIVFLLLPPSLSLSLDTANSRRIFAVLSAFAFDAVGYSFSVWHVVYNKFLCFIVYIINVAEIDLEIAAQD